MTVERGIIRNPGNSFMGFGDRPPDDGPGTGYGTPQGPPRHLATRSHGFRVGVVRRISLIVVTLGCVLVLAGCGGGSDDAGSTPAPTARATQPPERPAETPVPPGMSEVVWTTEIDPETREPEGEVTSFTNEAAVIIAAVQVSSIPAGEVLTATWSIDGLEVPEMTTQAMTDASLETGWATFQLRREEGRSFPLGELQVQITTSDGTEVIGAVKIVLP